VSESVHQNVVYCARRNGVAIGLLVLAVLFLVLGAVRTYKVYDNDDNDFAAFGVLTFNKVSDRHLVEDATFSGVVWKGDKLYSTYDRMQPRGKKACPT
jgi:hypothetical protein